MILVFEPNDPRCSDILDINQKEAEKLCSSTIHLGFDKIISIICSMSTENSIKLKDLSILMKAFNGDKSLNFALYYNEGNGSFLVETINSKPDDLYHIWTSSDKGNLICYQFENEQIVLNNLKANDIVYTACIKDTKGSIGFYINKKSWLSTIESAYSKMLKHNINKGEKAIKKFSL